MRIKFFATCLALVCAAALAGLAAGCSTTPSSRADAGKGGAQLWGENCGRCHNIPSPATHSPAEWEVIMLHMRIRANLTAEEHTKILAFMKSSR